MVVVAATRLGVHLGGGGRGEGVYAYRLATVALPTRVQYSGMPQKGVIADGGARRKEVLRQYPSSYHKPSTTMTTSNPSPRHTTPTTYA